MSDSAYTWQSLIVRPEWMQRAACRGVPTELFFTERGESTAPARDVCRDCEVRAECLAFALNTAEKFGTWGGVSERGRRRLRRQLNLRSELGGRPYKQDGEVAS